VKVLQNKIEEKVIKESLEKFQKKFFCNSQRNKFLFAAIDKMFI
jgi:hypothetical protein